MSCKNSVDIVLDCNELFHYNSLNIHKFVEIAHLYFEIGQVVLSAVISSRSLSQAWLNNFYRGSSAFVLRLNINFTFGTRDCIEEK